MDFGLRTFDYDLLPMDFGILDIGLWPLDYGLWTSDLVIPTLPPPSGLGCSRISYYQKHELIHTLKCGLSIYKKGLCLYASSSSSCLRTASRLIEDRTLISSRVMAFEPWACVVTSRLFTSGKLFFLCRVPAGVSCIVNAMRIETLTCIWVTRIFFLLNSAHFPLKPRTQKITLCWTGFFVNKM